VINSRHLTPIPRTKLTQEIITRLVSLIVDEGLSVGDKLPSERKLMAQLSVGRSSLREAISILSAIGVVDVSTGEGMFVGRGELSFITKPLSLGLLMGERSTSELVAARRLVEVELAGLAAKQTTEEEVAAIDEALQGMRAFQNAATKYSEADMAFHLAVGRGAHNGVLYHMLETLQHIIRVWILRSIDYEGMPPDSLGEHVPIYLAIRARDKEAARRAMSEHLGKAGSRLLAVVSQGRAPQTEAKVSRRPGEG
jgi:GntR family transcriptional repressor for pyruvate dehydrogenase complex